MTTLLSKKDKVIQQRYQERMIFLMNIIGVPENIYEYPFRNDSVLAIIEFKKFLNGWFYVTNGLSEFDQPNNFADTRLELICYTKKKSESAKQLLLTIAEYPFEQQEDLWVWDTIPASLSQIGFPAEYKGVIFTPPPFFPEKFEFFKLMDKKCRVLGIQGITEAEKEYVIKNGGQEVGEKIMRLKTPWIDQKRKSVI
jgi:hypothetical protein